MAPGPALAAVLAAIPLAWVPNDQILAVQRAQYRQLAHEQARMAAVIAEVGRCEGFPPPGRVIRCAVPGPYAAEESRAALSWTRRCAEYEHDLAETVVHGLPAVFASWLAGDLHRARVVVFDRYLAGLVAEQIGAICRVAVPRAPGLTTGQLAVSLRRMVIAVDPDAAERWYRDGIAERNVIAHLSPDEHPGEVPGLGLLPARAARARVAAQRRAQWRFAVTDDAGRLVAEGVTRRRPTGTRRDGPPGGIVELHLPAALLTELLTEIAANPSPSRTNLGPVCRHDHRVKHTGGWKLTQPQPGTFHWRSPLGGHYRTHGEFLHPMPDPIPSPRPDPITSPVPSPWPPGASPRPEPRQTPDEVPILHLPVLHRPV